mmetsp:Transcript_42849/g.82013  ORF Transcript_42849/g.82013 Transcript_42849/m.82013 type:complete len:896 (+) Transcript_42849:82-2769(+)|eukprot:CAMPEP_0172675458 /NCGR_PEP_ID=MMETSP1074-20121228/13271_1 /TAXON_ID=2916 /ORGANISM="Ceratium fusus, Strain PA161109" /LENGTH=895 /DNA_ID=CAMNT_0013492913 /DNA_START=73 /DNA_END=2760 /DNA_ORIENTATION=+
MAEAGQSPYLSLKDRPAKLKEIVRTPCTINSWSHNGESHNYRFGKLDGKKLVTYFGNTRDRMNVLDVGCGAGAFLHECASDVSVTSKKFLFRGITGSDEVSTKVRRKLGDVDPAALERAITDWLEKRTDCIDLKIYEHVSIEDIEHSSNVLDFVESATRFDLIFCSWTALHVCDPFGLLVQLYDMLDVDGIVVTNMFFAVTPLGQVGVLEDLLERGYDVCVDLPDLAEKAEYRGCRFEGIDIGIRKTESQPHLRLPLKYTDTIEIWGRVFGSGLQNDEPYSVQYSHSPLTGVVQHLHAQQSRCRRVSSCLASWAFGVTEEGQQKLLDALRCRDLAAVKKAVAEGADPNLAMPNGLFAVEMAVHSGFGRGVKELFPITTTLGAASKFCCAAAAEEVPTLKAMLAEKPDLLDDSTFSGMTPLMVAATCDSSKALCLLLHRGAEVDKMLEGDPQYPTALGLAVSLRKPVDLSVVCILLGHGADWRMSPASPALHNACTSGRPDIVREIIAASVDRETGLVAQHPWCGQFPMGLTMREVELAASGGVWSHPGGGRSYVPNYERKASENTYVEIVKELYPVTADDVPGGCVPLCRFAGEAAVAEGTPSSKQEAAIFLEKYGISADSLVSSVTEEVRQAKFHYGDKVRIDGLKSATDLNGHVGLCCGTDPKSARIRVSLISGLKLVKAFNLVAIKAEDQEAIRTSVKDSAVLQDLEGVNAQISDALMRKTPAPSGPKVVLLTFSRDPAALAQTLLQAAELAPFKEALAAEGLDVQLPSGAKIFVRPEHHGPTVEAIRLYGLSLKPKHVVVEAELEQDVLKLVESLRPKKVYAKTRTIMPLALAELAGNCDYEVDISRTFIDIRVSSSLCSYPDQSHHAASTTQADPRKCRHQPKPKKRARE